MAKIGEIKLIPSIEGVKHFTYNRGSVYAALGDEWRQDLDDFLKLLNDFSNTKEDLEVNIWTDEDFDFDRVKIRVVWKPSGLERIDRFGNRQTMGIMDEAQFARAIGYHGYHGG